MVTLQELRKEKAGIIRERNIELEKQKIELQKIELQKQIMQLKRTPAQMRNIRFVKRTSRGLKLIGKTIAAKASRQFKRIAEQQKRDNALLSRSSSVKGPKRQLIITRTITGKGKKKKTKITKSFKKLKTGQKLSKIKESPGIDIFNNLDF